MRGILVCISEEKGRRGIVDEEGVMVCEEKRDGRNKQGGDLFGILDV